MVLLIHYRAVVLVMLFVYQCLLFYWCCLFTDVCCFTDVVCLPMLFYWCCLFTNVCCFTDVCLPMFVVLLMFVYHCRFIDVVCLPMFVVLLMLFVYQCLSFYWCYMFTCWQREEDLTDLIMKVIQQGLEGLVLKDTKVRMQYTLLLHHCMQNHSIVVFPRPIQLSVLQVMKSWVGPGNEAS